MEKQRKKGREGDREKRSREREPVKDLIRRAKQEAATLCCH